MKRSLIITLALIAAIAVPLCASSGWARGLGVLGLGGGGAAPSGPTLLGSWLLDDNTTGTSVVAATGANGTLYGVTDSSAVSTTDAHTDRAFSLALSSGDYVTIPVPTFSTWQNKFTVEFWVKGLRVYNSGQSVMFSIGPATGDRKLSITQNGSAIKVVNNINGGAIGGTLHTYASDDAWKTYHHVQVQYDVSAGVIKASINGGSVTTITGQYTAWAATPTTFGIGYTGYGELGGFIIDDLKFYAGGDL